MPELVFALAHYFAVGMLGIFAYVFGRRLTLGVRYDSLLEQLSFSVALGLGLIAYLVFGLGLCGLLYPALLAIVLLIGLLMCHRVWSCWLGRVRRFRGLSNERSVGPSFWFVAALCVFLLPLLVLPLYPPTAWDATEYHLASAKSYVQNHQIVLTPYLRFPVFPQVNQMLFTLALLLYDDVSAQLVELLIMAVLIAAIIAFGQRYLSSRSGLWAAAILLQSPLVVWSGTVAYVDMCLTLFVMMTVYAIWNHFGSPERHWLMVAGCFCGLAASTKYPGLFFLVVLAAVAVYTGFKQRKKLEPLLAVALALVILAPWLARNVYYTRNPLFPFFSSLFGQAFGYSLWKPEDYQGIFEDIGRVGKGRDLKALIMLPWNLTANWRSFGGRVSGLPFFAPHLLFVLGIAPKRIRWLLAIGVGFTGYWFLTIQDPRYVFPALPLLSLATAAALEALLQRLPIFRKWTGSNAATVLGTILLLLPGSGWALLRIRERGPLPVTAQKRDAYLSQQLPSYPAYQLLNGLMGRNYTLYALYDERMAYFADGRFMGDHLGLARYSRVLERINDGQMLYDQLKGFGADHLLVRNDLARVDLPRDEIFKRRFKLIYDRGGILLFELSHPEQPVEGTASSGPVQ